MLDDDEPVLEKAVGTDIAWKPGKNVTVKVGMFGKRERGGRGMEAGVRGLGLLVVEWNNAGLWVQVTAAAPGHTDGYGALLCCCTAWCVAGDVFLPAAVLPQLRAVLAGTVGSAPPCPATAHPPCDTQPLLCAVVLLIDR